jgi:autotransporter-associated beta strand protein
LIASALGANLTHFYGDASLPVPWLQQDKMTAVKRREKYRRIMLCHCTGSFSKRGPAMLYRYTHVLSIICIGMSLVLGANTLCAEDWSPIWSTATLSQPRYLLSATSDGGKVFIAGGYSDGYVNSGVVDIYDSSTGEWSTMNLPQARHAFAAASAGGEVFFGGGASNATVDIYNTATNIWSTASLSEGRSYLAGASCAGKVAFGGGYAFGQIPYPYSSAAVDIYDTTNSTWSTASLSQARYNLAAASAGNQILFAGGEGVGGWPDASAKVDIFNVDSNTWSTGALSQARYRLAGASVGSKVLFGGGWAGPALPSSKVDIYDSASQSWSTAKLSQAREDLAAASVGDRVLFAGGHLGSGVLSNVVDIFNSTTNTWSTSTLSQARNQLAATTVGNKVFFAGGVSKWDAVVSEISNVVDVYTLQNYGTITSAKPFALVDQTTVAGRMQLNAGSSLNLDGYNLSVGSMGGVTPINLSTHTLTTGSDNTDSNYAGNISGNGTLIKTGSGALTLSGTNSYLGLTTIGAGELNYVGPNAWNPITNLGGAYLSGGDLVFDYTSSEDPYTTILCLLGTKINGATSMTLVDDIANKRVTLSLAVPEPSDLLLATTGLLSLLTLTRRRWKFGA